MKVSQNAHVVLSLGPQNVTTPSLMGESLRVARIQLLQVGLQLGEVTVVRGSGRLVRHHFAADSAPGNEGGESSSRFARGASGVAGFLHHAVARGHVPAGRGSAPHFRRIKLAKTTFAPSPQWPKGAITEQTPEPGTKITSESAIEMVVAQ